MGKTRLLRLFALGIFAVALCGCSLGGTGTVHEKIQKKLTDMKSYRATANVTRISNKGENTYGTKQCYKTTGEYRLEMTSPAEVAGNYTVYDGKTVCQYNPKLESKVAVEVEENQARNELFLGQFVKNYLQSEGVMVETAKLEEGRCTVLEAIIPGDYKYTATEKLWIDNETLLPVQMIIYDTDGNERYITTYDEFEYNVEFDEDTFKIPE
ncbi:MAG: outer-membrane lipoprotein carrier protein LolA [Lachnospiraceae bacterium]|nr:outer-membrane lipoprotein carrier protein LolA [Lachnospiraceae bacterium]